MERIPYEFFLGIYLIEKRGTIEYYVFEICGFRSMGFSEVPSIVKFQSLTKPPSSDFIEG